MDLGPPSRVHYKEDERMTIHSTSRANENSEPACSCRRRGWLVLLKPLADFYNYFHHGLDFLLSPSHVVTKIVLHTNIVSGALI
jgi:hypothetical protein